MVSRPERAHEHLSSARKASPTAAWTLKASLIGIGSMRSGRVVSAR